MNQLTEKNSPDEIWINGTVLTLNPEQPQAEAISILKGKVLRVGSTSDLQKTTNSQTIVHDLNGQFLMPGLIDTHAHGIWGALRDKFEVYVGLSSSLDSLMLAISERASKVPENEWISGGPWHMSWIDDLKESPKKILDLAAPHHFVALKDVTYHTAWINT
jgi:predicted amidohydrolase YtcJ